MQPTDPAPMTATRSGTDRFRTFTPSTLAHRPACGKLEGMAAEAARVRVTRVYDPPGPDDGARVLVDRLWPRGLKKADAAIDHWCRDIAPSTELRTWYGHDAHRFEEFAARYQAELDAPERAAALDDLRRLARQKPVTLLTATKQVEISQATVLAAVIASDTRGGGRRP
jgi:uncharacterized protein YeaO (DUF488 family)